MWIRVLKDKSAKPSPIARRLESEMVHTTKTAEINGRCCEHETPRSKILVVSGTNPHLHEPESWTLTLAAARMVADERIGVHNL